MLLFLIKQIKNKKIIVSPLILFIIIYCCCHSLAITRSLSSLRVNCLSHNVADGGMYKLLLNLILIFYFSGEREANSRARPDTGDLPGQNAAARFSHGFRRAECTGAGGILSSSFRRVQLSSPHTHYTHNSRLSSPTIRVPILYYTAHEVPILTPRDPPNYPPPPRQPLFYYTGADTLQAPVFRRSRS